MAKRPKKSKAAKLTILCFYCKRGTVKKIPATCPVCKKKLTTPITGKTKLPDLVELALKNGVRLRFQAVPLDPKDQEIADRVNHAMKTNRKLRKGLKEVAEDARKRAMNVMLYGRPNPDEAFVICLCGKVGVHCPTHGKTTT